MKNLTRLPIVLTRALAAFVLTVALAVIASLVQLMPDVTAESVDVLPHVPEGIDQIFSTPLSQ